MCECTHKHVLSGYTVRSESSPLARLASLTRGSKLRVAFQKFGRVKAIRRPHACMPFKAAYPPAIKRHSSSSWKMPPMSQSGEFLTGYQITYPVRLRVCVWVHTSCVNAMAGLDALINMSLAGKQLAARACLSRLLPRSREILERFHILHVYSMIHVE